MHMTIARALRDGIAEEMRRDSTVFCIGEDIGIPNGFGGSFTVTWGLEREFGRDRVRDTPISEAAIIGAALGAAVAGMRPIADFQYGDFLFCAMDQIANETAKLTYMSGGKLKVPVVIRVPVGATSRGAQHSQSLEAFLCHVPGLKVVAPATAYDAKGLLKTAVREDNPVVMFEHKLLYGAGGHRTGEAGGYDASSEIPEEDYEIPFGRASIWREGTDITLIGKLLTSHMALAAAEQLAEEGIQAEVIDARSLVPFDKQSLFASVGKTGRLIIAEEDNMSWGWAAEVAALVCEEAFEALKSPVVRISAPDVPAPFSPVLEKYYVPSVDRIVQAAREMCR